ncbi:hypothetical protein NFI96_018616, partial [Prochilodus magdalenae]
MQLSLKALAIISAVLCIAVMGTNGQQKLGECCREVSTKNITVPITGFRLQNRDPPCVKAVIFYTANGAMCSHWRESWVQDKIRELRKLQTAEPLSLPALQQIRGQLSNKPNMQLSLKTTGSLAIICAILCISIMGAYGQQKRGECCREVSTKIITVPITGFRLQKWDPPCFKAVIFYTAEGAVCSHWRQRWVQDKIRELRKLQTA